MARGLAVAPLRLALVVQRAVRVVGPDVPADAAEQTIDMSRPQVVEEIVERTVKLIIDVSRRQAVEAVFGRTVKLDYRSTRSEDHSLCRSRSCAPPPWLVSLRV